ncbi:MAG: AMP-binding protein, partial [Mycolicibacterium aromaticivorans]|nr:AMP-binding protein [Mycolicibacterium aromaticivorans]
MHALSRRISDVLGLDPEAHAIEYDGHWYTWRQLADASGRIASVVRPGTEVGILLRNSPAHVAALLGVLAAGGCVVVINPSRGAERIKADLDTLTLPVIVGTDDDITLLAHPADTTTVVSIGDVGP